MIYRLSPVKANLKFFADSRDAIVVLVFKSVATIIIIRKGILNITTIFVYVRGNQRASGSLEGKQSPPPMDICEITTLMR